MKVMHLGVNARLQQFLKYSDQLLDYMKKQLVYTCTSPSDAGKPKLNPCITEYLKIRR